VKVTLKTIAEESGFSITTVSRALAGYNDVREQTRQHIIEIAERLGYQPNLTARHLRSKHTDTIGMVIPRTARFSDPFFMELLSGVGLEASEHGYDLLLSAQMHGEEELSAYRRMVAGGRMDGMVVARVLQHDPRIDYLKQVIHPFVVFGRSEHLDYPYIDVDGSKGMYQLVKHFFEAGHRCIALILSPDEFAFTSNRLAGFHQAIEDLDLEPNDDYVIPGDLSRQSGATALATLLDLPTPPTAIISCNDTMALGAMEAMQRRGLQVGSDIAIAGFDDIPEARYAFPPLTTIRQPIHDIGARLADMLIRLIRGEALERSQVLLEPELIIRQSSG
jgi:LacI family transcriptional regulator